MRISALGMILFGYMFISMFFSSVFPIFQFIDVPVCSFLIGLFSFYIAKKEMKIFVMVLFMYYATSFFFAVSSMSSFIKTIFDNLLVSINAPTSVSSYLITILIYMIVIFVKLFTNVLGYSVGKKVGKKYFMGWQIVT
jgi:hypothetical protein